MATRWTSKHTGQKIDDTIDCVCNPNLLDNWYFGNPVNQRGQTNYSSDGYTIDRFFKESSGTIILENDGIIIDAYNGITNFIQKADINKINSLLGKTVTLSALFSDNTLLTDTGTFPDTIPTSTDVVVCNLNRNDVILSTHLFGNAKSYQLFRLSVASGYTKKLKAVKLELGSQQTLAHQDVNGNWVLNEIPNYGEQLRRCQRYFWRSWTGERYNHNSILGRVFGASANRITGFSYPVEMRSKPTITIYGITGRDKITDYDSDVDYGDVGPVYWDTQRCMALSITGGVLSMDTYVYYFVEANAEL